MVGQNSRKVVILGLDGTTLDLIQLWVAQGFLPNFQKILTEGASGKLRSVIPPHSAQAWSTLYTGKNLGKHGVFDFIGLRPNSYKIEPTSFADNRAQTFWEIANCAGKRTTILNTPLTYPVKQINGILISGLQTPPQAEDFTYPRNLKSEIDRLVAGYKLYPIEFTADYQAYLRSLYEVTEKKFKLFLHLLKQEDWDLFMCVTQGTDLIQHYFWQFMDSSHPRYSQNNQYQDAIRKYYQKIDSYLGEFISQLGQDTTLLIVSDHGCTGLHKHFYINTWLYKCGLIKFKRNPTIWIKKICFHLNFNPQGHFFSFRDIDWAKTRAFSFTNTGQIFVNLKGRQPQGTVQPGKDYQQVCQEIVRSLEQIKDPQTNEQIIEKAYTKEQLYSGEYASFIPDIFYLTHKGKYINKGGNKFYSKRLIENCSQFDVNGGHDLYGIALFYGNGVKPRGQISELNIQDIAPIVLAIFGLEIPQDMDGKVSPELFQEGFLQKLKFSSQRADVQRDKFDYSAKESAAIQERLKDLGYVD